MHYRRHRFAAQLFVLCVFLGVTLFASFWLASLVSAQEDLAGSTPEQARKLAEEDAAGTDPAVAKDDRPAAAPKQEPEFNLLKLFFEGGPMMYPIIVPIFLFSLLVLVFGFERMLAIRRSKVIPAGLVHELGRTFNVNENLQEDDLKLAYRICNAFPSAAAKVIKVALLKASRPHAEVEHAVKEASEREADKLYSNVRPLNLAAAVTPLLGLLGTVLGMIMAFQQQASGSIVSNKAEAMAQGIYTALITTFVGLSVAIPAAILAHWFEGRIQKLFREIDELLLAMLPALEQFENRLKIRHRPASSPSGPSPGVAPPAQPQTKPPAQPQTKPPAQPQTKPPAQPREQPRQEQAGMPLPPTPPVGIVGPLKKFPSSLKNDREEQRGI